MVVIDVKITILEALGVRGILDNRTSTVLSPQLSTCSALELRDFHSDLALVIWLVSLMRDTALMAPFLL